jgi:glycosyltransferase involved in cell wall biosynthesis
VIRHNLERICNYLLKLPPFVRVDEEAFLEHFTCAEWQEYELWLFRNRHFTIQRIKDMYARTKQFRTKPRISVIMPLYNPDPYELQQAIESLLWQTFANWELRMVDDNSSETGFLNVLSRYRDKRIRFHALSSHSGIARASQWAVERSEGDFIAFMDQDDELYPDALFSFVAVLQEKDIHYFYSDRDMISPSGKRYMHFFKPDWSPEYLLSFNYTRHLEIFSKDILLKAGGIRSECEGSQDYDLALRVTECSDRIIHYPMVLYSWRQSRKSISSDVEEKSYVYESGIRAVGNAVKRRNLPVREVLENSALWRGNYRIVWDERAVSRGNITFVVIGRTSGERKRLRELLKRNDTNNNAIFLETDYNKEDLDSQLRKMNCDGHIFFCDDAVVDILEAGIIDMLGYLSIDGVEAVGCKFIDMEDKIHNAGLSITGSGKVLFSYRDSPLEATGYGAGVMVPRNVSAVFPSFWGCRTVALKNRGNLGSDGGYFLSVLRFFKCIIKSGGRIAYVPYMCLRVDKGRMHYEDDLESFQYEWIRDGLTDGCYNPNLTDICEDFGLKL